MQGDFYNALLQQQIQNHAETMRTLGSLESTLESVHGETRKTNGRVTQLEKQVQQLQESRSYALGGLAVIGALSAFIGAGVTFVFEWLTRGKA
jgi:hypothetical protein